MQSTLWDRVKQGLRENLSTAACKAEYLGRLGRARLDVAETRHALHEAYARLGEQVYRRLTAPDAGAVQRAEVQDWIEKIGGLEGRLNEREAKVKSLQEKKPEVGSR